MSTALRAFDFLKLRTVAFSLPQNLCTHLQNVSRSTLARTSVPYTQSSLTICAILLRHGLISNMTLGDPTAADPTNFRRLSPPQKRIWLGLKYRNGIPVLRNMSLISKPSKRIYATKDELGRILTGRRAVNVAGVGIGEILVVKTPDTLMEGWEAWRAGLGGELILRCS
ncbi:ribosomal protein S8 [Kockovaella imperatae]|uniref:Ribosomal protein S8 n=1 Tax=Kockovaella imperatae TaxID=4999 RepID=A0A1Y1UEG3_9TREE|nr:ribosomal protein S8 [Kockovaella imperatae]ORX36450.1 ribosomal protein S8 [Kockovaella imperatae]